MVFLYHIDHIADETLEGFADHSNKCMTTSLQPDRNVGSSSFMLEAVFRLVPVLVEGVRTNVFRLGCPVYCTQLFPPPGPGHWRSSWILLLSPPSLSSSATSCPPSTSTSPSRYSALGIWMSVGPNGEDTVELPCSVGELKVSIRASPTASNGSFDSTSSYPSLLVLLVPSLRGPAKAPLLYFEFVEFFGGSGGSGRAQVFLRLLTQWCVHMQNLWALTCVSQWLSWATCWQTGPFSFWDMAAPPAPLREGAAPLVKDGLASCLCGAPSWWIQRICLHLLPVQLNTQEGVPFCDLPPCGRGAENKVPGRPWARQNWGRLHKAISCLHLGAGKSSSLWVWGGGSCVEERKAWGAKGGWFWDVWKSHINVLEGHAGLAILTSAAEEMRDARFLGLMGSRVAA